MYVLSSDRTIHELSHYFSFFHVSLSETPQTRHLADSLRDMMEKMEKHGRVSDDLDRRQLVMRARITVCIFFLRKAIINLGKEIRKAELALKTVKFYDDILPFLPPGSQIPLQAQLQKFRELAETALANFDRIPDHPKCEPVRMQCDSLVEWSRKAAQLLEENERLQGEIREIRGEFREIQSEVHAVVKKLQKEFLGIFDYNLPDIGQYFLTLSF